MHKGTTASRNEADMCMASDGETMDDRRIKEHLPSDAAGDDGTRSNVMLYVNLRE